MFNKFNKFNTPTAITIGAVALILGAIGPWVTVLGLFGGGPTNSFEVGLIVFGGIGLLLCSAFSGRFMRTMSILISVLILIETANVFYEVRNANDSELGSLVSPGWGLYLTVLACLWLIASTFVFKTARPSVAYVKQTNTGTGKGVYDPYGHCDTCGSLCGPNGCLNNPTHVAAIAE
jgi:hypothetical protein